MLPEGTEKEPLALGLASLFGWMEETGQAMLVWPGKTEELVRLTSISFHGTKKT